ncbi:LOW QUALITY PROTEIN: adhesion G protein-coupled receptor E3-like [Gopherus flavomarginatus]|uniref:LOW QUALITY PROTEIN: adhesion G protein-coupled receptor E3-like n=1 Tax=Gopherus flavomarginatus TaxID=286002 RepID=UPI0021CC3E79|nr:LOW QUALITY PROTEIN: adhesion G protein-coupled receptor E3-like [Gopherus flavomarginatus]
MSFGLEKVVTSDEVELPAGHIADIQTSYKYLGVPQSHGKHNEEIPCRYSELAKEDMEAADVKTQKLLTMHGGFHPKSNTQRLYTSQKEGGRGLVSVKATVLDETRSIQEYINICSSKATCINTIGSYRCKCWAGYVLSTRNSTMCEGLFLSCPQNMTLCFNALLNSTSLWDSRHGQGSAVTVLLQSVELAALATALRSLERTTQNVTTESLAIQKWLVTGNCSQHSEVFKLRAHEETMDVHCDAVTGVATQAGLETAAFISYSILDSIISARRLSEGNQPGGGKLEKSHLNSRVVSGAVGDGRPIPLSRSADFTLCHRQAKKEEEEALCIYWKVVAESGSWSPDGCTAVHRNSTHTTCSCDHLSSFAVLMAPIAVTESSPLTIITYVGLTLSLLCLFLAILTFLLCRSIRNVSTSLHLQLCLCLFLADLLFLTPVTRIRTQQCAPAGLSRNQGLKKGSNPIKVTFFFLPVCSCWLSLERGFHWSFLGPVCAIILINIMFFVLTLWILRNRLFSLNADVSTVRDHRLLTFKAIAQLFLLGCTWSLGLLQVGPAAMVMAYLFTIVSSLQGAFIFLVHCLLNGQSHGNHDEEARKTATSKYHQRIRQVLKSQRSGKNKIHTINRYALLVIRYPAGIVSWSKEDMEAADVKTRKLLTMHGGFHPKSNTQRLYTSRKEGRRGLVSIKATVLDETRSIQEYIRREALITQEMYHLMGICVAPEIRAALDRIRIGAGDSELALMATFGEQIGRRNFIAQAVASTQDTNEDPEESHPVGPNADYGWFSNHTR